MIASLIVKRRIYFLFSIVLLLFSAGARTHAAELPADVDRDLCKKNLSTIYNAIKSYRADHKDIPPYLSDLVPKYLKDPNVLVCPAVRKTGNVNNFGIEDPKLSISYTYEFSDSPIPENIYKGSRRTMKEWKRRQMAVVGSKVPMVRCHQHGQELNLSFDGRIYESQAAWEQDLKDEVDPADLSAARLFAADLAVVAATKAQAEIPPRDPKTPARLIDLSKYYNASLTEEWHRATPSEPIANDLSWLPKGIQKFADVEFDTRGLIQLSSRQLKAARYPSNIRNIRVDQKAVRIHFLQGTGWNAPEGTPVATYVMHYANGQKEQFTILYGVHVIDWVSQESQPKDSKASVLAWTGKSPTTGGQMQLHLYKTQWKNPFPDQPISTIDYLGSNEDPAPFLIAITLE